MVTTQNAYEMALIFCVGWKVAGDMDNIKRVFIYLSSEVPVTLVLEVIV